MDWKYTKQRAVFLGSIAQTPTKMGDIGTIAQSFSVATTGSAETADRPQSIGSMIRQALDYGEVVCQDGVVSITSDGQATLDSLNRHLIAKTGSAPILTV